MCRPEALFSLREATERHVLLRHYRNVDYMNAGLSDMQCVQDQLALFGCPVTIPSDCADVVLVMAAVFKVVVV